MAEAGRIFPDLSGEEPENKTTVIESCCMNCYETGQTRLLLTKIPFYKEVILMSFTCEHCGFENNEIKPGGEIEPKGCKITLSVKNPDDFNRRIVKSDFTSIKFIDMDFEIPAESQKGEITTLEGIVERARAALQQEQPLRRIEHPQLAEQIDEFLEKLDKLKLVESPFTVIFEDISGNCRIENPNAPHADHSVITTHFNRTKEQDHQLGMFTQEELKEPEQDGVLKPIAEDSWPLEELHGEVLQFRTNCPECKSPCETNMKVTSIPHFKDVVIMATVCDVCGAKTNEVKSGGGIEEKGVCFTVDIQGREDMSRDVLKSDTCSLHIPQLDCEVGASALGGRFTTIEGILNAIREQLADNSAVFQDSENTEANRRMDVFLEDIAKITRGELNATLILNDPAGNSYVQSLSDDGTLDARLKIEQYERSFEQNEELGLNDLKTENYGETN